MGKAQLLVVEDEHVAAWHIQTKLTQLGYKVVGIVSSGEEALETVNMTHPDLVLMDIMLKGKMDGVEAAEQIKARFDIPVIYLTAYINETIFQRAKITAPLGYILKPFHENELYAAIETALFRHKMEQMVRESEQWLAITLRCIGDAVITTDKEGHITFVNPVAEMLTAWKENDALGAPLGEVFYIIDESTGIRIPNPISEAIKEGNIVRSIHQTVLIAKDGKEPPIDYTIAPIKDDKAHTIGVVLVFRDITEQRLLEAEHMRLITALESAGETIMIADKKGIIQYVNPAFEKLTGYSKEEAIEDSRHFLKSGKRDEKELKSVWEILKKGQIWRNAFVDEKKDGTLFDVEKTIAPVRDSSGKIINYIAVSHDITERKHLEILEATGREQQRIGQDLHDRVCQLLTGIAFLSKVLEHKLTSKSLSEESDAAHIVQLVNQAITETRALARGLYPVEMEAEGIISALHELASYTENLYNVSCQFNCATPVQIKDNNIATHLYRIAQEAVTNAIKHGRAAEIIITLATYGDFTTLTVEDNGIGIPQVFPSDGGLGLRIMACRASMIGGSFHVARNADKGTRVICSFKSGANKGKNSTNRGGER